VSYRTFKHLLGETSLERKCRYIFGIAIAILVSISFYWYGQKTESLVIGQKHEAARLLVNPIIMKFHAKSDEFGWEFGTLIDELSGEASPLNQKPDFGSRVIAPWKTKHKEQEPADEFERAALSRFLKASEAVQPKKKGDGPRKALAFADGAPMWDWRILSAQKQYQYAQAVTFQARCLTCHHHDSHPDASGKWITNKVDDLACVVSISLPMDATNKAITRNQAFLIATAIVTALLAMVVAYAIVRYVIVKPVKHLRDVSDSIAAGKLTIRAQIQTGDEFEELAHAFNRMLHNLVSMQQELRDVNNDLDRKIDELAQANMALFEMNRIKSDFLATMSHELRTPLNSIIGFSEVLFSSEELSDRQRKFAQNIQTSGRMLLAMINDILDLAKIESGKMEVRVEDFSLRDVCEGLLNLLRPMAERKDIDLACQLDDAIPLLRQDPGKLRQVLYNLLSNAIKFTPDGGRVTLRALIEGRQLVLSVADTGIGIAEEDRERIFEKFRQAGVPGQADSVLTREHQGTGLGLSIVRELCKLLGGDVSLDSQPGQGSTFTIRLPMQLPGSRKFEIALSDDRIDLSKARRVEPRTPPMPHSPLVGMDGKPTRRNVIEPIHADAKDR
jgi:two-component system, NarL family, sensor histidine kinase BarA